jgi:hypothetical protein
MEGTADKPKATSHEQTKGTNPKESQAEERRGEDSVESLGVNEAQGTVDGEYVGLVSAALAALARRTALQLLKEGDALVPVLEP